MHFVFSVCVTLVLAWLAVFFTARGLQTSAEAATAVQLSYLNEYKEHQCGSVKAAIENLKSANNMLQATDMEKAKAYENATESYLSPLEEILDSEYLSCDDFAINLHTQSIDETPFDLPNLIYRLSSLSTNND
jgi:hypothetical protein